MHFLEGEHFLVHRENSMHIFLDRKASRGSSNHIFPPCVDSGAEPWVPCEEPSNILTEQSKWENYSLSMGLCLFLALG